MPYTVGELARLTGVTVRTLHHYDELGLVCPSARSDAGYRLYAPDDLLRLRQVLFYRELGFPLDEIARVLDDPAFDRAAALREQRAELLVRRTRVDGMIAAVDAALASLEKGTTMTMTNEELKDLFDGFDPKDHEEEAAERWGHTEAFQESQRRTKRYGKKEWEAIKAEGGANYARFAELMRAGRPPGHPEVQAAVDEHRAHITRWFYPCTREIQRGLGEMYVADGRFTANIDKFAPGLAVYVRDAIRAAPADE